jgi:hypothetical protein
VKNRFQNLPFKCNLQRYNPEQQALAKFEDTEVGLYKYNCIA